MVFIVVLGRMVACINWLSEEGSVSSVALEVKGALNLGFDKSVSWTVGVNFWLGLFLVLLGNVCG